MPMASAAAASRCMRGWARTTCSRSDLPRPIRTTSFRSTAARSSIPASGRRARCGLGARRAADLIGQAARHPDHGDQHRPRRRRARLRPVADGHDRTAVAPRRTTPAGAADTPRRTGADADAAGVSIGTAQVALPPGSFLQATVDGEEPLAALVSGALQARQTRRRSVLRGRPLCASACGEVTDCRLRQRRRRGRGAAEGRDIDVRAETGQGRDTRPVPPSADAAGIARLRYCRLRPAAAGRAGASRRSLRPAKFLWWSRCPATSRPSRATPRS